MTNENKTAIYEKKSSINESNKLPLNLFQSFESAARNLSFTKAANELNLTSSAISHAIKKLESTLQIKLFERGTRNIILTDEGTTLLQYIKRGLEDFNRGIKQVSYKHQNRIRVHVAPTFASQYLLPILAQFIEKHPNIDIQLSANTDYVRFGVDNFDLDIVYGEKPIQPNTEVIPLALEILTPLCSPEIAKHIKTASDLYDQKLIQCSLQLYQWQGWFEANNLQPPNDCYLHFDRSFMALNAAENSLGVVLESTLLAGPQLSKKTLVCPLIDSTNDIHYIGHYLIYSSNATERESIVLFRDWLLNSLGINRKLS